MVVKQKTKESETPSQVSNSNFSTTKYSFRIAKRLDKVIDSEMLKEKYLSQEYQSNKPFSKQEKIKNSPRMKSTILNFLFILSEFYS